MPNRYTRDELIKVALNMARLPNLEVHDCPEGVVQADAFSIQWLQDILDFWYHMVPFSATVTSVQLNCTANQGYVILPSDFILDVRNGYVVEKVPGDTASLSRIYRLSFQKFLTYKLKNQRSVDTKYPMAYCVQDIDAATGRQLMQVAPVPTIATNGVLWYYKLPAALQAGQKPTFPNDYVCIEYIRIRGLEWAGIYEPGTAQKFCEKIVASMRAAGLLNEPEDDQIQLDERQFPQQDTFQSPYSWMGPI